MDKTRTSAGEAREEVLEAEVARPSKKQKRRKEEGVGEVRVAGEAVTSDIKEEVFEEVDGLAEEVSEQVIVKADPGDFQGPEEGGSRGGEGEREGVHILFSQPWCNPSLTLPIRLTINPPSMPLFSEKLYTRLN